MSSRCLRFSYWCTTVAISRGRPAPAVQTETDRPFVAGIDWLGRGIIELRLLGDVHRGLGDPFDLVRPHLGSHQHRLPGLTPCCALGKWAPTKPVDKTGSRIKLILGPANVEAPRLP